MAIVSMNKVEIYGLNKDRKKIIEYLHCTEAMEFRDVEGIDKKDTVRYISQFDSYIAQAGRAIEALEEVNEEKKALFSKRKVLGTKGYGTDNDEATNADKYIMRVLKDKNSVKEHEESIGKIVAKKALLEPYMKLDVPMNVTASKKTRIDVGTLDGEWSSESLCDAFSGIDVHVEIISGNKQKTWVWIVYLKKDEEKVNEVYRRIGFVLPGFGLSHRTPADKVKVLEEAETALKSEIKSYEKDLGLCLEHLEEIKLYYDHLIMRREKYRALSKVGITKNTFVMQGYIPEKATGKIVSELEGLGAYVTVTPAGRGDDVPVAFSNNGFASPVEGITSDYSMPSAVDIDPNPIMAFFYYFFFGMMFSDAGYGLLMMIVCGILGFSNMIEKKSRRMFKMFFFCGISTTFWGIMYGSFFGDMINTISNTFGSGRIAFTPVLMDPTQKPLELLILSVSFGMIHILTGLIIKFYMLWREKKRLDAVFDVGFWILVLVGLSVMAAGLGLSSELTKSIGIYMALGGAAGLVLTQGRSSKNVIGKLFGGILSLYDITSYVGDVLSYSRLMALGLATGVIASVINVLGALGGKSIIGLIVYIAISIFGHALNFAINMLGAYVHTNRLQYVEFYQKFYEGGGKKFEPLSMDTKYYNFSEN